MDRAALVLLTRLGAGWLFALSGLLVVPVAFAAEAPLVIVISMDGVRHDYPDRSTLPGFERMEREGARAERLTPVFPASTFPNHVALATGTHADMGAIFFAMGRGVPAGAKPGVVRGIDVGATVADLLGIEPPLQSEGHPIKWSAETR